MKDNPQNETEFEMLARLVVNGFDDVKSRLSSLENKVDNLENKVDNLENKVVGLETKSIIIENQMNEIQEEMRTGFSDIRGELKDIKRWQEEQNRKNSGMLESIDETIPKKVFDKLENRVTILEAKFA